MAKPLSDLTSKRIPANIPWGAAQNEAFEQLKKKLIEATSESLQIVDLSRPFIVHVDTSNFQVAGREF